MLESRPRIARLISAVVQNLALDLRGRRIVTEAATGAYAVTPVIAALAGGEVTAVTKATRYGSVEEVRSETIALAQSLGVADRIRIVSDWNDIHLETADVVTNAGHVRPLSGDKVSQMRPGAVVPLMYESWEFRADDLDLAACKARSIVVAGTNERHPKLRVFDYLGMLAILGLQRLAIPVPFSKLLLICGNPFAEFIKHTLVGCHAEVTVAIGPEFMEQYSEARDYDAVILADTPSPHGPNLGAGPTAKYRRDKLGHIPAVVQVWGDVDRDAFPDAVFQPANPPKPGHMGVLLSELGPDPIVKLQAGGLKVGEVLLKGDRASVVELEYCQVL